MIFPIMNQRIGNPNLNNSSQNLQYDLRISRKSVSALDQSLNFSNGK